MHRGHGPGGHRPPPPMGHRHHHHHHHPHGFHRRHYRRGCGCFGCLSMAAVPLGLAGLLTLLFLFL